MTPELQVNSGGVVLFLALAGSLTWFVVPIGPTWALASVLLGWLLVAVVPLVLEYVIRRITHSARCRALIEEGRPE